jgi:hypothetical protein
MCLTYRGDTNPGARCAELLPSIPQAAVQLVDRDYEADRFRAH